MVPGLIISDRMWPVARLATASSFFYGFNAVFLRREPTDIGPQNLLECPSFGIISRDMQYVNRLLAQISLQQQLLSIRPNSEFLMSILQYKIFFSKMAYAPTGFQPLNVE